MNEERASDRLARYIINLSVACIIIAGCWYFRSVLIYIILAAVLSFMGRPLYLALGKLDVRGHHLPDWTSAVLTIVLILGCLFALVTMVVPVFSNVASDISRANVENMAQSFSGPLKDLNRSLIRTFPKLGWNFKIESVVYDQLVGLLDFSAFSSVVGSVASVLASVCIALFAMVFISFFFIRNPGLFTNIVLAFVPDSYESKVKESLHEIGTLISRYLIGLFSEVMGVSLINFLGLYLIARMGLRYSIGIAFMTGLFNIVPYLGPLIGGALGLCLTLLIKYACVTPFGISVGLAAFVAIVVGIFVFTQLVDNYLFQPLIYSTSIKAHPLEIFIVILMAGHFGGILGMLVAIPGYTVARVIAVRFFGNVKAIKMLTGEK